MEIFTVSTIIEYMNVLLEINDHTSDLWLRGEVSNCSRSSAGHYYFRLKDEGGVVECALFRNSAVRLQTLPRDGMSFVMHGRMEIYPATGRLQFIVNEIFQDGQGKLSIEFEYLKKRLEEEGLFAIERKRPLPERPQVIGVVTSPQAAAFQDILNVLRRRYPLAQVVLSPTAVQGEAAPTQIVEAIRALNSLTEVEVIILARGGGSLEELWAFNDEKVARAVFASRQPVITGVGHETDYTIVDYVADLRAPTPSAAAEIVSPDINELRSQVEAFADNLYAQMQDWLDEQGYNLANLERRLLAASPAGTVAHHRREIDAMLARSQRELYHHLRFSHAELRAAEAQLKILNPAGILQRGYSIVSGAESGEVISDISQLANNEELEIRVSNGKFRARVS